jgi:drug/metabolite transporter (DMT)-like permease
MGERMTPRDILLYATAVFCWGTSWLALRIQSVSAPPETAVFWRFVLATVLMGLWVRARGDALSYDGRAHRRFLVMGVGIFSTNFMLYYHGGKVLTSGLLPVLFSLAVVGNLVLGALFLDQRVTRRLALGALVGVAGVALMFVGELATSSEDAVLLLGVALCSAGTFSFCIGNVASALSSRAGVAVIPATFWGMVYGTAWTGIVVLLRGEGFAVPLTMPFLLALAWLVVFATIVAFWAYLSLVQSIGTGRAGYATVMFPIVGLFISTFAETLVPGAASNYQWTVWSAVGLALAVGGNVLVLRR